MCLRNSLIKHITTQIFVYYLTGYRQNYLKQCHISHKLTFVTNSCYFGRETKRSLQIPVNNGESSLFAPLYTRIHFRCRKGYLISTHRQTIMWGSLWKTLFQYSFNQFRIRSTHLRKIWSASSSKSTSKPRKCTGKWDCRQVRIFVEH